MCTGLIARLGVEDARNDDIAVLVVRLEATPSVRFQRRFPARSEQLRDLRASMRGWLRSRGVGEPLQRSVLLAVWEACANAIEHAYVGMEPSDVRVDMLESDNGGVRVEVRDFGRFRSVANSGDRGRGTIIMQALTTDFSRESTSSGTVVRFHVHSGAPFEHA